MKALPYALFGISMLLVPIRAFAETPAEPGDRGLSVRSGVAATGQEGRIALVIGNGAYSTSPLRNPVNDARAIGSALRDVGFEVLLETDANQQRMEDAIRTFGAKLRAGGVGLFYYAGHGVQVKNTNYLVPVGAEQQIRAQKDIRYKAVELGQVLDEFQSARNRLNILILDACRNNPFRSLWRSAASDGLAPTPAPRGTLVAYATSPGSVAADGSGSNGLYTTQLLETLRKPGLDLHEVFLDVMRNVESRTGGDQRPSFDTSVTGQFFFRPGAPGRLPVASAPRLDDLAVDTERLWSARLEEMEGNAQQTRGFETTQAPPSLKAVAWQRFLDAYRDDDPFSVQDDALRAEAQQQLAHWKSRENAAGYGLADLEPAAAARAALESYREHYVARDFQSLEGLWVMNPRQRRAMKATFECAKQIELSMDEVDLEEIGGMVYIHFDQELAVEGDACKLKPTRSQMTATLIHQGGGRWMISSILPRR